MVMFCHSGLAQKNNIHKGKYFTINHMFHFRSWLQTWLLLLHNAFVTHMVTEVTHDQMIVVCKKMQRCKNTAISKTRI